MKCDRCDHEMQPLDTSSSLEQWVCSNLQCEIHQQKVSQDTDEFSQDAAKVAKFAGGSILFKAVDTTVTGMTGNPIAGKIAGGATKLVPEEVKIGAAIGSVVGGSIPAHAMLIGTTGGMAFGATAMLPAMLTGALIFGGITLVASICDN